MLSLPRIGVTWKTARHVGYLADSAWRTASSAARFALVVALASPTALAQWEVQGNPAYRRVDGPSYAYTYPSTDTGNRGWYPTPQPPVENVPAVHQNVTGTYRTSPAPDQYVPATYQHDAPMSVQAAAEPVTALPPSNGPGPGGRQVSPLIDELCQSQAYCDQGRLALADTPSQGCNVFGDPGGNFDCVLLARGSYLNDQRIQWSGLEATFGVEGVLAPVLRHKAGRWETALQGEFYLNQPFDRNIFADTQERRSYAANYDVDTFEISQLRISLRNGNRELVVGKMATPFGRAYFPLYSNARLDAPFIRTESILWRETGLLLRYDPGCFVGEVGITNGSEDRDTNSSKGLVSRLGFEGDTWALGLSAKLQDGIGSEDQKQFNNHVGVDFMTRCDWLTFSGEIIYDEYGFRQPGFNPDDMTWRRSLYFRDMNNGMHVPITGVGYYLNLDFANGPWRGTLNYGEFYPQLLGDPRHDTINRRGIVKIAYDVTSHLNAYTVVMVESEGYTAQAGRLRRGKVLLAGLQYTF